MLGVFGGVSLARGAALAIAGAGAGVAVVVAAVLAGGGGDRALAGAWRRARRSPRAACARRPAREALSGRHGVVRNWSGAGGQVLVDGALWRARRSWPDEEEELGVGDSVVVERVNGLTLAVRSAEEWEEPW